MRTTEEILQEMMSLGVTPETIDLEIKKLQCEVDGSEGRN